MGKISVSQLSTYQYCPRKLFMETHLIEKSEGYENPDAKPLPWEGKGWLDSDRLRMRGVVDEVREHDGNVFALHDKSGSAPRDGVWAGHRIQMGAYMLLLEEIHKEKPVTGVIRYGEEERQIVMNPYLRYEVMHLRDEVDHLLHSSDLPDKIKDDRKCMSCALLDLCYDDNRMSDLLRESGRK